MQTVEVRLEWLYLLAGIGLGVLFGGMIGVVLALRSGAVGGRVLGWALLVAVLLYFLYTVRGALVPFMIGGVIALLLNPLVEALCRRGMSRIRAILNVFLLFLLFLLALGVLIVPSFYTQARLLIDTFSQANNTPLSQMVNRWVEDARTVLQKEIPKRAEWIENNKELLTSLGLPSDPKKLPDALTVNLQKRANEFLMENASGYVRAFLNTLLGTLSKVLWIILIPLSAFFFLLDMPRVRQAFLFMVPPAQREGVGRLMSEIGGVFFRYIRGLATVALTYGMVSMAFYWVMGAPNPVLLGVLAGLLYPIPYVGAFLIALSSAGFTLIFGPAHPLLFLFSLSKVWHAVAIVAGAMVLNTAFDLLITPRIAGGAVGLRPLAALIAIVIGASIGGLWGMLIAVPLATSIKLIVERLLLYFYGEAEFLESALTDTKTSEPAHSPPEPSPATAESSDEKLLLAGRESSLPSHEKQTVEEG